MKVYLAGCGKIGARLGTQLRQQHEIVGLKRSPADFDFPVKSVDLCDVTAVGNLPCDADVIVFTVTPSQYDEIGYRHVYETAFGNVITWAEQHKVQPLVILVSSTSVYGQQKGEWVDESSETKPERATSQWILAAEQLLLQRLSNALVIRFSGIYGNGRNRLIDKVSTGETIQQIPPLWTNRIHEDDCVGVLAFFIEQYQQGNTLDSIYLASDNMPVTQYDICAFIAKQLSISAPPIKTEHLSYRLNKRCHNHKLRALGYTFKYPDFYSGY